DPESALPLDEDTFNRRRRVLGPEHPDTLASAHNLALTLRDVGKYELARELHEDTHARMQEVLGVDHPDTLISEENVHRLSGR
ncbi:tetratricopeptide repeat protein, partial [Parafrankia colletiae]